MKNAPGKTYLKVTGIIYIVCAAILILFGGLLLAGGALVGSGTAGGISEQNFAIGLVSGGLGIAMIIYALLGLIMGILGVKNCNKPEKAGVCFVFGVIVLVLGLIGMVTTLLGGNATISTIVSSLFGLIIPGCYTYGAHLNKKSVQG